MDAAVLRQELAAALAPASEGGAADSRNPVLEAGMRLGRRLASGEAALQTVAGLVRELAAEAFADRAERLGGYLGESDPAANAGALERLFDQLAQGGDFDAFAAAVARPRFGLVLTGHPTFALRRDLSLALVELATGRDLDGRTLDEAARRRRLALAEAGPHDPPDPLTLDVEHDWSVEALHNALDAAEAATRAALAVARRRWPDRWTELTPRLLTLATWVGFDQDGRTDVTWLISIGKRLSLKLEMLKRLQARLANAGEGAQPTLTLIDTALATVGRQAALLDAAAADVSAVPAFARAMVEGREAAMTTAEPLITALNHALASPFPLEGGRVGDGGGEASELSARLDDHAAAGFGDRVPVGRLATPIPDPSPLQGEGSAYVLSDVQRETLLLARATLTTQGLSLAHVHVRLNAAQLHAGVRETVGLETDPSDPANRRTYFHAIDDLISQAKPRSINFGALLQEPSSARRLMMTVAQMAKLIDASAPVRFLIAESESGFTLLAALYLARLFGIEAGIEISPLFETAEGFEAGERLIEEALRSEAFRAHLERHGRLAIEFGFSDSGRFIGQMAATFRIERLRLRLAEMLVRLGLSHLEVVFFNTHGESIGRGGHPLSLADRFRYAAPPRSRAEFAARGIALKEEDSFQGGEGYLPLFTPAAALATVRTALESVLAPDPEAESDPIYQAEDFASEFFATVQQAFAGLVADPNYPALLGLYGTRLLRKTGSRPEQRQSGDGPRELSGVHELRAIPNNGVLQQLGWLANTLYGVGRAATKDPATFAAMSEGSPRFRRALRMVAAAQQGGALQVLRAYAALNDPDAWMAQAACARGAERAAGERLSARAECADLEGPLGEAIRRLESDALALADMLPVEQTPRRARLLLAHTLRIGLMAQIDRLGASVPARPGATGFDPDRVASALMRFDPRWALDQLNAAFPLHEVAPLQGADFGEPTTYAPDAADGHVAEQARLIGPIAEAHALCLQLTSAITHDLGACG